MLAVHFRTDEGLGSGARQFEKMRQFETIPHVQIFTTEGAEIAEWGIGFPLSGAFACASGKGNLWD